MGDRVTESLNLGGIKIPQEAVTETFAILAKRGKGKTYTASVMAEEMIGRGLPVLIIDPLGVWWGLRSSANGTRSGLPVVIFGGQHADVPLTEGAGELIADVVVDERIPAIIDLSDLSKSARRRFMAPFLERLYHRNREPLHVFIDEADMFAPQRAQADGLAVLGAMEDLQRRGRARGIGTTLITQRPAVLHKDVLTQAEVLIVLGMTGPQDIRAIDEWVHQHADQDAAAKVKGSLPGLDVGEAWVWSPSWLNVLQRVKIRKRRTFDSSATPKAGERRPEAREFQAVDVDAITKRVEVIEEKRRGEDPRLLRQEIATLRADLTAVRSMPVRPEPERVEVEVLTEDDWTALERLTERLRAAAGDLAEQVSLARLVADKIDQAATRPEPERPLSVGLAVAAAAPKVVTNRPVGYLNSPAAAHPTYDDEAAAAAVTPARRKILDALASLAGIGVTSAPKGQVALWAGVSPKSSGFANNLGGLRSAGLIDYPSGGRVAITAAGYAQADTVTAPMSDAELHAQVQALVTPARWKILEALIAIYPDQIGKAALAQEIGVSAASSGYANNLGALRSLGLIDYPGSGQVAAAPMLFIEGR